MALDLKNIKLNVPQVALDNYTILLAGVPKSGKTTLFAQLIEKYYGDINCGLLLAFEKGYSALKVNAVLINSWDDFEDYVDQLVDEKDELPFKIIGIDTCDICFEMACDETIREWNLANPSKRTKDIGGVGAKGKSDQGYGVGYQVARQKIRKNIDKLMKAGYGIVFITHSKDKETIEKSGLKYDQLVVSLSQSARELFVNLADFVNFITIEKEKNEDDEIEAKRYIYFRTDGYVEAGSRFKNVPEKIEYSVDEFINVIKNAITSEFNDDVDLVKLEKEQEEEKRVQLKEQAEEKSLEDWIQDIKDLCKKKSAEGVSNPEINKIVGKIKFKTIKDAQNAFLDLEKLAPKIDLD